MTLTDQIKGLLDRCTPEQRREILAYLRATLPIHPIEAKLNTQAEIILEAIDRASDLTLRGIRGIIAEAAFAVDVLGQLAGWRQVPLTGDPAYDFLLEDAAGPVRIQVKMQRRKAHRPMAAHEASRALSSDLFVVETQRTRGGTDPKTGADTRPYRFGDFDILAVSMHPSTNDWHTFLYTVGDWLLPRPDNPALLAKFQPVAPSPNDDWTDDLTTAINWFRSSRQKRISP